MNSEPIDHISQIFVLFDFNKIISFVVSIVVLVAFVRAVKYVSTSFERSFPARRLLISQIETIVTFMSYIFGVSFLFFAIIQPPKELMFAAGGSVAVALGLSLKDLVASVVAGIILLFDRPFQVGDRVTFEGNYGEIRSIGLRAVRLLTLDDSMVTIPNSKFITEAVSSGNSGALDMMIVVKFYFDRSIDINEVKKKIHDVIATSKYVYLKKPIIQVVTEELIYGVPAILITAKCYVLDVKYEKALETDIYSRATKLFKDTQRPLTPFLLPDSK